MRAATVAAVTAVALCAGGRAAHGAGESEWQLSARLGAGSVNIDGRTPWGAVGALDLEYGITDAWAGRVSIGSGLHPVDANPKAGLPGGRVLTTAALVGATYTFDVLRLVPYAEGGIGLVRFGGAVVEPRIALAAELGVGADYLLTPRWAFGISFQYLFVPADLFSDIMNLGNSPFAFSATLRAARIF